ncbi:hypothetical protein J4E91_005825 [Alternaria rosae]|nr:hypothetical protein J4E91_005825 [Alternaria rosae]
MPTAEPRDAVEVALDPFRRARHDTSLHPSVWDEVVDTFDEQQRSLIEGRKKRCADSVAKGSSAILEIERKLRTTQEKKVKSELISRGKKVEAAIKKLEGAKKEIRANMYAQLEEEVTDMCEDGLRDLNEIIDRAMPFREGSNA